MQLSVLRAAFLEYFKKHNHEMVASSSLVPFNDDTLLFTNAGMVPFKDVFLGQDKRDYSRATSAQRCVRAGGKHNDLENVGYTARHHTFFEMMGNFSFGDYFKKEAIELAWNFLTQELKIPAEKLWVTVYQDDQEAEDIWLKDLKVSPERMSRCGEKDNFWSMGDTGPCGPCSEIFYDHGETVAGGPPGSPDEEGDRYVEIWNLVFMQYNRDKQGNLAPLPKPSIDTGMGLERMAAVMQGVHSNYETDLFQNLIKKAQVLLPNSDKSSKGYNVIADHIRAVCFLIVDGVLPSNEGRGYVVRRIMRRALRYGHQLGASQPFFHKMVSTLVELMGDAYPELVKMQDKIEKVILKEEIQFSKTLDQGLKILENEMQKSGGQISGETAFKLYDTYGFPIDLTTDIAREKDVEIDLVAFEQQMAAQKQRARSQSQFGLDYNDQIVVEQKSDFTGYFDLSGSAKVSALLENGVFVEQLDSGSEGVVVLDQTPFYAESGGQVGDKGILTFSSGTFEVQDTQKSQQAILHIGIMRQGTIKVGDSITTHVDPALRNATTRNHSATHLLHATLREILGEHVTQKGSLVSPDRLRFDFSHFEAITPEQLQSIEARVNEKILENSEVQIKEMSYDDAIAQGVMALFGEKYGKTVRVLAMGNGFSVELCGGAHVNRTADIGLMAITQESGVAAGIRRIEAVTGEGAFSWLKNKANLLQAIQEQLKADDKNIGEKISQAIIQLKALEKENQQLKQKLASNTGGDLASNAIDINGMKLLVKKLDQADPKMMRQLVDDLKNKLKTGIVVLASVNEQKVQLIVGVTKDCTDRVSAGELIKSLTAQVGGAGGGRADMAQAGGTKPEALDAALHSIVDWVKEKVE
tara:strand:+ start:30111 stop:32708 length:2598 start_codon:yes stop_codon:yes gene_type:complete